ncbi:uncharacterized protein LOC120124734 [Hibiscus syriacus]|uniref:uncharacterized protein LOC120124734 n=1 Tax=Hibiscus syriacus TaxID=106335 RepID=UPI001921F296|nr:uncharacterized protein LOC120124734 [Hibiscus syriacus]
MHVLEFRAFIQALYAILTRFQPPPPAPAPRVPQILIPKELRSLGPPEFRGDDSEGPMDTDLWLNDVKAMLDSLQCSDHEKLSGAVSLLRGSSRVWWINMTMARFTKRADYSTTSRKTKQSNSYATSSSRAHGEKPLCQTCGKSHGGVCRLLSGACFYYGESGHFTRSCPKKSGDRSTQSERSVATPSRSRGRGRSHGQYESSQR